jgi:hypothetical protein
MSQSDLTVRAARPRDAAAIARLSRELNEVVGDSTEHCTPENIKTTLFGHDASFHVLVAAAAGWRAHRLCGLARLLR